MSDEQDSDALSAHDEPPRPRAPRPGSHRGRSRTRRLLIWGVEILGGLLGLALLLLVLLAARLQFGPLEADALNPVLTSAINERLAPLTAEIRSVTLGWRLGHATIDVTGNDFLIRDPNGRTVLTLPRLMVSLDLRSLLRRHPLINRIGLVGPSLHIIRDRHGGLGLDVTPEEPEPDQTPQTVSLFDAIDQLATGRGPFAILGQLDEVTILGATARFDDEGTGISARLSDGKARLHPTAEGIAIELGADARLGDTSTGIAGSLNYDRAKKQLHFAGAVDAFVPAALAGTIGNVFPGIARFDLPLSVKAELVLGDQRIESAVLDVAAGAGSIADPSLVDGKLEIHQGGGRLAYDAESGHLTLDRLSIDLGGPVLEAHAELDGVDPAQLAAGSGPPLNGRIRARLRDIPLSALAGLWPTSLAPHAREWVTTRLTVGSIPMAQADAVVTVDPAAPASIVIRQATGNLAVRNATVDYLPGLSPVEGVDAVMDFTPERLNFGITGGHILGIAVPTGSVVIDQLNSAFERLTLDLGIAGPVEDLLRVLDSKRLGYASEMGIDPKSAKGLIAGNLHFRLPLKHDVAMADVDYGARAQIVGLSLPKVAFGQTLDRGVVALILDPKSVAIDGLARLGQVPVALHLRQRLAGTGPITQVWAQTQLDDAQRRRFGLDILPETISGPIGVDAYYLVSAPGRARAALALDLGEATLSVPEAGWQKSPGDPAHLRFGLTLVDDHVTALDGLTGGGRDFDIGGGIDFQAGRLVHAALTPLHLGPTEGALQIDHPEGAPWHLGFTGKSLDLERFFKTLKTPAEPDRPGPDLAIDMASDRVTLGPGRVLDHVRYMGRVTDRRVITASLAAKTPQGAALSFDLTSPEQGADIRLVSEDFGETLRLFDVTGNVLGGRVTLTGKALPQAKGGRLFTGTLEGKAYRVAKASFLTKLLSSASFTSITSLLQGEGIPFDELKGAVCLKDGRLTIEGGRAWGGAVAINASGIYDIDADTMALSGTLVPAYLLNSLLGNVPLIGPIINGGEGEGLFAFSFRISGRSGDPDVYVNPASAVMPGFVRGLFSDDVPSCAASEQKSR